MDQPKQYPCSNCGETMRPGEPHSCPPREHPVALGRSAKPPWARTQRDRADALQHALDQAMALLNRLAKENTVLRGWLGMGRP